MELKDFISKALLSTVNGVNESGTDKEKGLKIQLLSSGINSQEKEIQKNQSIQHIQFSVLINEQNILKNKLTPL